MRESQVERRKGEKMSKVIRLNDYTKSLINQYREIINNKKDDDISFLTKDDQTLIQLALIQAIKIKKLR